MAIKDWPETERPREKLLKHGAEYLSDAELLAIFLKSGTKGRSAIDVARDILSEQGDLRTTLNLDKSQLCKYQGVGVTKFIELQASLEIGRRYLFTRFEKDQEICSSRATVDYLQLRLRDKPYECFYVIFLDAKHRVIHDQELFRGTIDNASVPVREVVTEGLKHNAAAMIVAHNHPSGVAEPSIADEKLTETISLALGMVGIRLLDHFVVGDGEVTSFAELGKL